MAEPGNAPYRIGYVDRLVGLVIVVALVLVAVAVVRHFRSAPPVKEPLAYHTLLKRSYGIAKGADIRLAGIAVGKVERIGLERSGQVRIDFQIGRDYSGFVTEGSYLEIASTMGLAAIVELTKLNFVSNPDSDRILPPGSPIETAEPVDLAETLSADEIAKLAQNVKDILANLAVLSRTMAHNQELISTSLANVGEITGEIRDGVRALPDIVDSATRGFDAWERAGTDLYTVIDEVSGDVRQVGTNSVSASARMDRALGEMTRLIAQLNAILASMQQSAEQVPQILSDAHALIAGANRLTERLSRHWLLGGGGKPQAPMYSPSVHPVTDPAAASGLAPETGGK